MAMKGVETITLPDGSREYKKVVRVYRENLGGRLGSKIVTASTMPDLRIAIADAQKELIEDAELRLGLGGNVRRDVTLQKAWDTFLESLLANRDYAEHTAYMLRRDVEIWMERLSESPKVFARKVMTPASVERALMSLASDYAESTRAKKVSLLQRAARYMYQRGWTDHKDPTAALVLPKRPRRRVVTYSDGRKGDFVLSAGDVNRLLAEMARQERWELLHLWLMALCTGSRTSALKGITADDYDLSTRVVRTLEKGGKLREVKLHALAHQLLTQLVADRRHGPLFGFKKPHWKSVAQAVGLYKIARPIHDIRTFLTVHFMTYGLGARRTQHWMGWESWATMESYLPYEERGQELGLSIPNCTPKKAQDVLLYELLQLPECPALSAPARKAA